MKRHLAIVGGGLWGGLLAWYLVKKRPEVNFTLFEAGANLGGNHTWSFHESDIEKDEFSFISPMIRKSWDEYTVSFPKLDRTVKLPYHTISSEKFHEVLINALPPESLVFGKKVSLDELHSDFSSVIDCRGHLPKSYCGWQKFLGLEVSTRKPHGLNAPVLMDAKVDQIDGFRFIYLLPYDEHRILIEDTRYSDDSFIDQFRMKENIRDYMRTRGWDIQEIHREESAALPIPLLANRHEENENILSLSGIFNETTGYSFPDAVRVISKLADSDLELSSMRGIVSDYRSARVKKSAFYCFLNRMMFHASSEKDRYKALEFFYRGRTSAIKKFYSGQMNAFDRVIFFAGRPPVDISKAMKVVFSGSNQYEPAV